MFLVIRPAALLGRRLPKAKNFSTLEKKIFGDQGCDSGRISIERKTKALLNDPTSAVQFVEDVSSPYHSPSNNKEKSCSPVASCDCSSGVVRFLQDMPPAHYRFKIDSFSKFSDTLRHANQKYLKLVDTNDSLGKSCRFDAMKTESGIPQLLPLSEFEDARNGFLVQDKCTFGAEILMIRKTNAGECIMPAERLNHRWVISPLSTIIQQSYFSDPFTVGDFKWQLIFFPKGCGEGRNNSISVFLKALDLKALDKVHAQFKLIVQGPSGVDHHYKTSYCFTAASNSWGYQSFLSLEEFESPSKGYVETLQE